MLLHPQHVGFHLVHRLKFYNEKAKLSFANIVHLLHSFDRGAQFISVLVKQVLELQQIFRRRALLSSTDHLSLGFYNPLLSPFLLTMFFTL